MALKDSVITVKGDQAAVVAIQIIKDPKTGNYMLAVQWASKTSDGKDFGLSVGVETQPVGTADYDNLWNRALPILRKANGLE